MTTIPCGTDRFERVRSDARYVDLEQSPPIESLGHSIGQLCLAVLCVSAVVGAIWMVG